MNFESTACASVIRQRAPGGELSVGDLRQRLRQHQAAVLGKAGKQNLTERLSRRVAAGGEVLHHARFSSRSSTILPRVLGCASIAAMMSILPSRMTGRQHDDVWAISPAGFLLDHGADRDVAVGQNA